MGKIKSASEVEGEIGLACGAAWKWLTKVPEYRAAHTAKKKLSKKESLARWGFYPLTAPSYCDFWYAPAEFIVGLGKLLNFNAYNLGVAPLTVREADLQYLASQKENLQPKGRKVAWKERKIKVPPTSHASPPAKLPKKILIELDTSFQAGYLSKQVQSYLTRLYKSYDYNPKKKKGVERFQIDLRYKYYVLSQLKRTKNEIRNELIKTFWAETKIAPESKRRRVDAFLKAVREEGR